MISTKMPCSKSYVLENVLCSTARQAFFTKPYKCGLTLRRFCSEVVRTQSEGFCAVPVVSPPLFPCRRPGWCGCGLAVAGRGRRSGRHFLLLQVPLSQTTQPSIRATQRSTGRRSAQFGQHDVQFGQHDIQFRQRSASFRQNSA